MSNPGKPKRSLPNKLTAIYSVLFAILGISACSTTFRLPPESPKMENVYLLKYSTWGHHSLAFYKEGQFTEFTYGDWELFALNKRDIWTAWKNITFFTQGALGRKSLVLPPGGSICEKFKGCETVVSFRAPADKVMSLWNVLQSKYNANSTSEVYNSAADVYFVKYEKSYWGFHNCNHELVNWLESLGGDVTGLVFYKPKLIDGMKPKQKTIKNVP